MFNIKIKIMKKIILFKILPILIACFAFVSISHAQSKSEKQKEEKSIIIKVEVDEDGNVTSTDTIITYNLDLNKEVNEVIVKVEREVSDNQESIKKIKVEVESDLEGNKEVFCINISDKKEELEKIFKDLQKEIEDLEIDKEARERIEQSMEKLQEVDWSSHYISIKDALVDAHHEAFGAGSYEVVKVVIEDGDTTEYRSTTRTENHHHDANENVILVKSSEDTEGETLTVWVSDDGEEHNIEGENVEVIVVDSDDDKAHKLIKVFVISEEDEDDQESEGHHKSRRMTFESASKSDLEKAKEAGINIDDDHKLSLRNLNVEVNNDQVKIGVMTNETGKLKVLALDEDFKTVKQIHSKKLAKEHQFSFDIKEFEDDTESVKYILIKQNGKMSLMTL